MKLFYYGAVLAALLCAGCGAAQHKKGSAETGGGAAGLSGGAENAAVDPSQPSLGMVELEVLRLLDRPLGGVVVLMQEKIGQKRIVPMVVGLNEGRAMSRRLSRQSYTRPLTHDLLETVLQTYEVRVAKVEIDDLKEGIFLARLFLVDAQGKIREIDARPSDSIVLALGTGAPLYINSRVVDETGEPAHEWESPASAEESSEQFTSFTPPPSNYEL